MKILVFGGTRFMGKYLVEQLLLDQHEVTIATRGISTDHFGNRVNRITLDHQDEAMLKAKFSNAFYDVIYDTLIYASNDLKRVLKYVSCNTFIFISSTAVYDKNWDTTERDFDPRKHPLTWCERNDVSYDEGKRLAEAAAFQSYTEQKIIAVRFPFVIGKDDYTKRLSFYVEHIMHCQPMNIDNGSAQMAFVRADEAGKFLAFLGTSKYHGVINGASEGTISIEDIAIYIQVKHAGQLLIQQDGESGTYNGEGSYRIDTKLAQSLGFHFTPLDDWIYELIDFHIHNQV